MATDTGVLTDPAGDPPERSKHPADPAAVYYTDPCYGVKELQADTPVVISPRHAGRLRPFARARRPTTPSARSSGLVKGETASEPNHAISWLLGSSRAERGDGEEGERRQTKIQELARRASMTHEWSSPRRKRATQEWGGIWVVFLERQRGVAGEGGLYLRRYSPWQLVQKEENKEQPASTLQQGLQLRPLQTGSGATDPDPNTGDLDARDNILLSAEVRAKDETKDERI
ncbi:unnamed protein product [Boreogadus saida]